MELSTEQNLAFDKIMIWHKSEDQEFVLAGYAGVGKSTLASFISKEIPNTMFCSYTGKAASVLRDKGCEKADTIHSYIYKLEDEDDAHANILKMKALEFRRIGDMPRYQETVEKYREYKKSIPGNNKKMIFRFNPLNELSEANLVIVDEYSMLDENLINDLRKSARKILYLGDPFQLPPVNGYCPLIPNITLSQIHRQAASSAIIRAATAVRENRSLTKGKWGDDFEWVDLKDIDFDRFLEADQVIAAKNKTRHKINRQFRSHYGYDAPLPMQNEKIICLQNNRNKGLYNGLIGQVKKNAFYNPKDLRKDDPESYYLDFEGYEDLLCFRGDLHDCVTYDKQDPAHREYERFDYGYCITAHKSQGSEFNKTVIIKEPVWPFDQSARWLYTALTRGKQFVTLVSP